jgi:hypothetical protein
MRFPQQQDTTDTSPRALNMTMTWTGVMPQ